MKKLFYTLFLLTGSGFCFSQTNLFTENFESASPSLVSTGTPGWALNNRLHAGGLQCDSSFISVPGSVSYLESPSVNFSGYPFVRIHFNGICKVEYFDAGIVEISTDGGANWIRLIDNNGNPGGSNNCTYMGAGNFRAQGSKFQEASYSSWQAGTNSYPDNTWWKSETFDISILAGNQPDVKVRFKLWDENNTGGANKAGWYIDDVIFTGSPCEFDPPVVVADFTSDMNSVCNTGTPIHFTNASQNATSFFWDFGDGTTSTDQNPVHTYTSIGVYTVSLVSMWGVVCVISDTIVKNSLIAVNDSGPVGAACFPSTMNYCCNYGIWKVTLGSITNNTQGGAENYKDYSCTMQTYIKAGDPEFIEVRTGTTNKENVKVWIDYDGDGVLNNSNELVFTSNDKLLIHQGYINTDSTAVLNTPVRVRVMSDQSSSPLFNSCTNPERGQVEDYSVVFVDNNLPPIANFIAADTVILVGSVAKFQDISMNVPSGWSWSFPGGTPAFSTQQHPSVVYYAPGYYPVTLHVSNIFGNDSITKTSYIKVVSNFNLCSGITYVNSPSGEFFDSGGLINTYQNNENCSLLVEVPCARTITLSFNSFNVASGDYFYVYDGANTSAPLILQATGAILPVSVTSSGNVLFIRFTSNASTVTQGFDVFWTSDVQIPNPVVADFTIGNNNPPIGVPVQFTNASLNFPQNYYWDFGDGTNSNYEHPVHTYSTPGIKNVLLIVSNCISSDTVIHSLVIQPPPVIYIDPDSIVVNISCGGSASFQIPFINNGQGQLVFAIDSSKTHTQYNPVKILALTYGVTVNPELNNTLLAISQHFQNYTLTQLNTTSLTILQANLAGMDILLLPENTSGSSGNFSVLSPAILSFAAGGGHVITCGTNVIAGIQNTGLFNVSSSTLANNFQLNISEPFHPLADSISSFPAAPNATYAYDGVNIDFHNVITYLNKSVVGYRPFGSGRAIYVGFDFYNLSTESSQALGNAVRWCANLTKNNMVVPSIYSDTVNTSDTTLVTVVMNISTTIANTFNFPLTVSSNDPLLPVYTIPVIVNITGQPEINLSDSCLHFGNTMSYSSTMDSVLIYNTGCDTLFITSVASSLQQFTPGLSSASILPLDSLWLPVTFIPDSNLTYQATLFIQNSDQDTSICLTGTGSPRPEINVSSQNFQISSSCGGQVIVPLTIYNNGGSPLEIIIEGIDTANVLALTYGVDYLNEYTFTMNAIRQTFNKFRLTEINTTSALALQNALKNKQVFYLAEPENGLTTNFTAFAPVLQSFVMNGGKAVLHGASGSQMNCMFNTGLLLGSYYGSNGTQTLYKSLVNHPITDSLTGSFPGAANCYIANITNPGFNKLVTTSGGYPAVGCLDSGAGMVIYSGFDYSSTNTNVTRLAGNIMRWAARPVLPDWVTISGSLDTIATSDSVTYDIIFNPAGTAAGTNITEIHILTNDPLNPEIIIPVTFTITGDPEINLADTCVNFGSAYINMPTQDSTLIRNLGCDTLFISNMNTVAPFFITANSLFIAPFDSAWIQITCNSPTTGNFSQALYIENNDRDTSICLTASVVIPPIFSISESQINVNMGCSDFISIPITIYNSGSETLEISPGIDSLRAPLRIFAYTYGVDTINEYKNTIDAIAANTSNFTITKSNTTDPVILQSFLNNADVLLFPKFETGSVSTFTTLGPIFRSFVSAGHKAYFCGTSYNSSVSWLNTGLMTGSYYGTLTNGSTIPTFGPHPVFNNITGSLIASSITTAMNITNAGVQHLAGTSPNKVIAAWKYGGGQVVFGGFDYNTTNVNASKIIANSMDWFRNNLLPGWTTSGLNSGSILSGDSMTFSIFVHSDSLTGGTYSTLINISTNDPIQPVITVPVSINVTQTPCPQFSHSSSACSGVVTFNSTSRNPATSFTWYFGDGTTGSGANSSHTYTTSGIYIVSLVACNSFGCDSIVTSVNVLVNPIPVPAMCTPQTQNTCCGIGIVNFKFAGINNTSQNALAGYENFTCLPAASVVQGQTYSIEIYNGSTVNENVYAWIDYNNDGDLSASELIYSDFGATIHNGFVTIPPSTVSGIPLRLRIGSENSVFQLNSSCSNPVQGQYEDYAVIIYPQAAPVGNFTFVVADSCYGIVEFYDSSTNFPTTWFWNFGDGTTSSGQSPVHQYTASGSYNVTLTVYNISGSNSVTIPVTIYITSSSFTMSGNFEPGEPIQFYGPGAPVVLWQWDFGDSNSSTQQNPVHTYSQPGTFQVTLTTVDSLGCTSTSIMDINLTTGIPEANIFSQLQVIPNPFIGQTEVRFSLDLPEMISINLYNALGECIHIRESTRFEPGTHTLNIEVDSPGVYTVAFRSEKYTRYVRIISVR